MRVLQVEKRGKWFTGWGKMQMVFFASCPLGTLSLASDFRGGGSGGNVWLV